jgi:hypothetical protein
MVMMTGWTGMKRQRLDEEEEADGGDASER